MDISDYRNEIDNIDEELVKLFERRMTLSNKIAKFKEENDLPIFNNKREIEVIEKNVIKLENKNLVNYTKKFFNYLMKLSKSYQRELLKVHSSIEENTSYRISGKNIKIGYQGVRGSFSEEAMIKHFGEVDSPCNYENFEDVFIALQNKEIDYGILPIENSFTGSISSVYDLLVKYGFYIVGEECIKIEQNLIGIKNTTLEDIKEIYSHPQGFEQSETFFNNYNNFMKIAFPNTAISAKHISNLNDKTKAAIASKRAAKIYNLEIIEEKINDKEDNNTKFIIIGRDFIKSKNSNKITVVFSLDNEAGTLYNLIEHFAKNNINMIKIESRPTKNQPWEYLLYVDFEGNIDDISVKESIKMIDNNSDYFRLLGFYNKVNKLKN